MEDYLPKVLLKQPFKATVTDQCKGKITISEVLTSAGVQLGEAMYNRIAGVMEADEIHPDVVAMLDLIEEQFADQDVDP